MVTVLSGQSMRFSHLDQKQGLSQNTADCFLQDRDGFMWVGTQDGLNRYDGYSFTVYRSIPGDSFTLSDNFILSLAEDTEGNIWIGTRNGLCVYYKADAKFYRYRTQYDDPKDFHASVRSVTALKNGGIVCKTQKSHLVSVHFNRSLLKVEADGLINLSQVRAYAYDASSDMLACLLQDAIEIGAPGKTQTRYPIEHLAQSGTHLVLDGSALYLVDSCSVYAMSALPQVNPKLICTLPSMVLCTGSDADHTLWLGTLNGLYLVKSPRSQPEVVHVISDEHNFFSLVGTRVESIYGTREGIMWVGTVGGINIYDALQSRFSVLHGILASTAQDAIWFVLTVDHLTLWANDQGMNYRSDGRLPKWTELIPVKLRYTAGTFDSRGRLWLGTRNQGIVIIDTVNQIMDSRFLNHADLQTSTVMDFKSVDGQMWVASIGSLCAINEQTLMHQMIKLQGAKAVQISTLYFSALETDGRGNIYVATAKGIYVFDRVDTNCTVFVNDPSDVNSLGYNIVNDLQISGTNLWIATMGYGIDKLDLLTNTFTHYTTSNGLANNTIYGIERGISNDLWLSSNEGLIQLNTETGTSRNFTMRDGLPSNEFVINKHCMGTRGEMPELKVVLYFGSSNGVVSIAPADFQQSLSPVKPVLTQVLINYRPRTVQTDTTLVLSSSERNISFEFAAIDFRNQDKISYAYMLEGFDTSWHETSGANRLANFTNLPYGQYTFKVRYRVSGEAWSDLVLTLPVFIETPFYATTWFLIVMIACGITVVALAVRYASLRRLRKQLEELRVQEEVRNEKERISRDLHDNVGAQLTYVISSLDSLSYSLNKNNGKESEKLEQLGEFARGTMDQLRESIWAINSEHISLAELTGKWKQYLAQLSETKDITLRLTRTGDECILKPTIAIEIHRIVQEAISNAFRHSGGTTIEVIVANNNPHLVVTVKDDGSGMPENPEKQGHYGLANMRKRAEHIQADLKFHSDESGTRIILSCRLN